MGDNTAGSTNMNRDDYYLSKIKGGIIGKKLKAEMKNYDKKNGLSSPSASNEEVTPTADAGKDESDEKESKEKDESKSSSSLSDVLDKHPELATNAIKSVSNGLQSVTRGMTNSYPIMSNRDTIEAVKNMLSHKPGASSKTGEVSVEMVEAAKRAKEVKAKVDGIVANTKIAIEEYRKTPGVYRDPKEAAAFIEKMSQNAFDEIQKITCI